MQKTDGQAKDKETIMQSVRYNLDTEYVYAVNRLETPNDLRGVRAFKGGAYKR